MLILNLWNKGFGCCSKKKFFFLKNSKKLHMMKLASANLRKAFIIDLLAQIYS